MYSICATQMCNFIIFFTKYGRFVIFEGIGPISFLHVPEEVLLGASLARPRGSISLHGNLFTSSHCTGSKLAYPGFLHLLLVRSELLAHTVCSAGWSIFGKRSQCRMSVPLPYLLGSRDVNFRLHSILWTPVEARRCPWCLLVPKLQSCISWENGFCRSAKASRRVSPRRVLGTSKREHQSS